MKKEYKKVLNWFRDLLKDEIDGASRTLQFDFQNITEENNFAKIMKKDEQDRYEFLSRLKEKEKKVLLKLMQESVSFSFFYFFRRLEEGEASGDTGRINFELKAINDTTGEETLLISTDENDDIDNDFQGWILDNCSGLEEDKEN